jgi:hypothetical protein
MTDTTVVEAAPPDKALVTFVRPFIFFGEKIPVYLWDGDHLIGVLGSRGMVQYQATPGEHLFLGHAENWTYATGNLKAGKRYLIKASMYPGFTMRAAFVSVHSGDALLSEAYKTFRPQVAPEEQRAKYEAQVRAETQAAMKSFRAGEVESFAEILEGDGH